ncbi:MAG TPA: acetoacetate decarboxylase family protein, partial [Anaeromyxobacter sp.]
MASDFLKVPTAETQTSLGPVKLPVLYSDGASLLAFFWVDAAKAARQLEGTGLEPARFPGGRALHGLAFYDYRETAIGPYHEVGSALAVQPVGQAASMLDLFRPPAGRRLGFRILDLPVSTSIANAAGREIWGYPKFVTDLPQRYDPGAFSGAVMAPGGGEILRLEGRARW